MKINLDFSCDSAWKYLTTKAPCGETIKYACNEVQLEPEKLKTGLEDGALLFHSDPECRFGQLIHAVNLLKVKNVRKCPRDRFLQELLKVWQSLRKLQQLGLPALFSGLASQVQREKDFVALPCRSQLGFLLLRCQGAAALLHRIATCSLQTFQLGLAWLARGHLQESVIPTMGTTCVLWVTCSVMLHYLDGVFDQLRASLDLLPASSSQLPAIPDSLLVWLEGRYGEAANPTKSKSLCKLFTHEPSAANAMFMAKEDLGEVVVRASPAICQSLDSTGQKRKKKRKKSQQGNSLQTEEDPRASNTPQVEPLRIQDTSTPTTKMAMSGLLQSGYQEDGSPLLKPRRKPAALTPEEQKKNSKTIKKNAATTKRNRPEDSPNVKPKKKLKVEEPVESPEAKDPVTAPSNEVDKMVEFVGRLVLKSDIRQLSMKSVFIKVVKKFPLLRATESVEVVKDTIREMVTLAREEYKS